MHDHKVVELSTDIPGRKARDYVARDKSLSRRPAPAPIL